MRRVVDHPVRGRETGKRLLSLRQGTSSVVEYAIDFRILAVECQLDLLALQTGAKWGPEGWTGILWWNDESWGVNFSNHQFRQQAQSKTQREDSQERSPSLSTATLAAFISSSTSEGGHPDGSYWPSTWSCFFSPPRGTHAVGESTAGLCWTSMDQRLCIYCGQGGHTRYYLCSKAKRAGSSVHRGVLVSRAIETDPPWNRLTLKGSVNLRTASHHLLVLVDSGADESFIDSEFVAVTKFQLSRFLSLRGLLPWMADFWLGLLITWNPSPWFSQVTIMNSFPSMWYPPPHRL